MHRITTDQRDILDKFEKAMGQIARYIAPVEVDSMHAEVKSNIENLEDMLKSAGDISASVSHRDALQIWEAKLAHCYQLDYLISLKMQQVTVVQAWQSMRQGDDTQKQNVTLLVFTVVTVVFVS